MEDKFPKIDKQIQVKFPRYYNLIQQAPLSLIDAKSLLSEKDALGRAKKGVTTPKLTKSKSFDDFLHQLIILTLEYYY